MLDNLNSNLLYIAFPYYIYSLEKENHTSSIISIIEKLNKNQKNIKDKILIIILKIYKFKYGLSETTSLNSIISELKHLKSDLLYVTPLLKIIEFEIYDISMNSNQFSIYEKFMKIFHK